MSGVRIPLLPGSQGLYSSTSYDISVYRRPRIRLTQFRLHVYQNGLESHSVIIPFLEKSFSKK